MLLEIYEWKDIYLIQAIRGPHPQPTRDKKDTKEKETFLI